MQAQPTFASKSKLIAVATLLLVGGVAAISAAPSASASVEAVPAASATAGGLMHDGVDWSQVRSTPVSTGATVGAYN